MKCRTLTLAVLLSLAPLAGAAAQDPPPAPHMDAAERTAVIAALAGQLHDNYVFPDVARQVSTALIAKDRKGGYAAASDADTFSDALSADLRALGKDGHFRVGFAPGFHPHPTTLGEKLSKQEQQQMRQEVTSMGYGIQRVERLNGNVGYMELRMFGPTDMVGDALSSAMTLLSGTDALILDLRRNGGGEPATVAYLMSHFFAADDKRHLNDIYTRPTDKTEQYWTTSSVHTHYSKPLYVLTSARTFSGGEEFAYDVQTQKRGTLIGETTGGGANPGDPFSIGHDFIAFIPIGKAINPITHTNWEDVGVKPDVATTAADAQKTAYAMILRKLLADAKDPDQREELQDTLHKVESGVVDVPNYARHP